MTPRISFRSIGKSFGGTVALKDVSFDVALGCVHALVGENGAGKSTLMKILAGAIRSDSGTMRLDDVEIAPANPREAQRAGIAIVYQELTLVPHLSVAENVCLGRWPHTRIGTIDFTQLNRQVRELFHRLGLHIPIDAKAAALSIAQQQMVEIARALSMDAKLLVLDEPSAVLTPVEVQSLFQFVRELTGRGVSVIYISHRLDEIFELADFVTVLRDGRHVSTRPVGDVTRDLLIRDTVGRELSGQFPPRARTFGETVLTVRELTSRGRFANISFEVHTGEVFGLTGLTGSGRSSIAKALFGAARVDGGQFAIAQKAGPFAGPRQAQRAGVALVPEDRKHEGLLIDRTLRENLSLASLENISTLGIIGRKRDRTAARGMINQHRIRAAGLDARMNSLSGGNQQKALIARWLCRKNKLVILDEPTRGVDVGAKAEIYALINSIAADGAAVLMISSELPEVIGMCDRIGVMREGRLMGVLENQAGDVTQEQIMRLAVRDVAA